MRAPRIIMRLDLTPEAAKRLPAICQRLGYTQLAMVSRLVEWYAELPDELRHALIGINAGRPSTRAILQHMIDKKR